METPTRPRYPHVTVELTDGNAFAIIGATRRALSRAGVPATEVAAYTDEAKAGDYDHLLQTTMRWVEVEA